ncbi:hypothetical protein ACIHDR_46955 [Nocardia sp. NPDC052278]|uniref:hypothetical protein n=1 Tax=unclassified Nocardia TaxID=2637762 RepID=UPI00367A32C9
MDAIVEGFRAENLIVDDVAETLFSFGCYVGEVFTRNAGGHWRAISTAEQAEVGWPIVVQFEDNSWCNPIGKVVKRLENGEADNLRYFYTVFTSPLAPRQ